MQSALSGRLGAWIATAPRCRESLEHVLLAATGRRPARREMLLVIPPWTTCFIRGINACDEHLRELEQRHPQVVPVTIAAATGSGRDPATAGSGRDATRPARTRIHPAGRR